MERAKRIGIFDSGFGGLSVMRSIVKHLPEYCYVYLGDSAHNPYGAHTTEEIYSFAKEATNFLFSRGCELVIFACNTASCSPLHVIQHTYVPQHHLGKKVLGVLIPFCEEAIEQSKTKRIGVIATLTTVRSRKFVRELRKLDPSVKVFQRAAPRLVELVEQGLAHSAEAEHAARAAIEPLLSQRIDALILGCTHFGFLKGIVRRIVGSSVAVITEEHAVPRRLALYLERHPEIERMLSKDRTREFFTTGDVDRFARLGSFFFGSRINPKRCTCG